MARGRRYIAEGLIVLWVLAGCYYGYRNMEEARATRNRTAATFSGRCDETGRCESRTLVARGS